MVAGHERRLRTLLRKQLLGWNLRIAGDPVRLAALHATWLVAVLAPACGSEGTTVAGRGGLLPRSSASAASSSGNATTGAASVTSTSASSGVGGAGCTACGQNGSRAKDCCDGKCVNKYNDIFNCAACGNKCAGAHP